MRVLPRRPQGATQLYVAWVSPFVKKHEEGIDRALEEGVRARGGSQRSPRRCGAPSFKRRQWLGLISPRQVAGTGL